MNTSGIVHAKFIPSTEDFTDYSDVDEEDTSKMRMTEPLSPDTNEFLALEQQVLMEEQQPKPVRGSSVDRTPSSASSADHVPTILLRTASYTVDKSNSSSLELEQMAQLEQQKQLLQSELESKLEERKRSIETAEHLVMDEEGQLQMLERRPLRSFSRADEYLYAMKEDLAEWLNILYSEVDIDADNFMSKLETGELLVRHANSVRQKAVELLEKIAQGKTRQKPPDFEVPERELPCRPDALPGTWFARDNVFNFITFCRKLGVMECVMFETEDLVCRKNEKHVILTLLEVARRGARLGMLAPMLVQFEQEIDREIAREERERRREEREEEKRRLREEERRRKEEEDLRQKMIECADNMNSMQVEVDIDGQRLDDVEYENNLDQLDEEDEDDDEEEFEDEEEDEDYAFPIGPLPQNVTNDLKSLDEMVRELVSDCQCPTQFPMIRVADGKYRIGDTQVLIFVRILRNHVMVRVGGGWDTLQHYLDKHDPCRCKAGHRTTVGAHVTMKTGGKGLTSVCYDRVDSPGTPRRRSSALAGPSGGVRSSALSQTPAAPGLTKNLINVFSTPLNGATPRGSSTNIAPRSRSSSSHQMTTNVGLKQTPVPHQPPQGGKNLFGRTAIPPPPPMFGRSRSPNGSVSSGANSYNSKNDSSLFQSVGQDKSHLLEVEGGKKGSRSDTLSMCDSGSEVSDEGYKSSQGGMNGNVTSNSSQEKTSSSEAGNDGINDRPESSLTVTSECSSTISSEEEVLPNSGVDQSRRDSIKKIDTEIHIQAQIEEPPESPIASSISDDLQWPPPPPPIAIEEKVEQKSAKSSNSRLSNLFSNMKIPKLKLNRKSDVDSKSPKSTNSSTQNSPTDSKSSSPKKFGRSLSVGSEDGGLSATGNFSRGGPERHSYRAPTATSRYMQAAEAYAAKKRSNRSACPSPTGSVSSRSGTWSSSTLGRRPRERPSITSSTFQPPSRTPSRNGTSRPSSRTASASPGPLRRRNQSGGSYTSRKESAERSAYLNTSGDADFPTSTHSTPARRPPVPTSKVAANHNHRSLNNSASMAKTSKSSHGLADLDIDDDGEILKRMEEILLTYKARVENHLAAEGRELPKEIFEDFTTQWVATCKPPGKPTTTPSTPVSKSVSNGNLFMKRELSASKIIVTPRRDHTQMSDKRSRIPMPTFYNSSVQ